MAASYGGEEFAVIMPSCNSQVASSTARQIRQRVNQLSFTDLDLSATVKVSVSQGIACEHQHQLRTPPALLCAADTTLHRAKSEGRDKFTCGC